MTGTALFGFVSRYKRGISVPIGVTEFYVHAARFDFFSSTYEWLVVAAPRPNTAARARSMARATTGFSFTATDGRLPLGRGTDQLRLKIWDKTTGQVVYDNRRGTDPFGC